jgi:hypothetical protein
MRGFHHREDGTIPCTNNCGRDVVWMALENKWVHTTGLFVKCWVGDQFAACPELPNWEDNQYCLWGQTNYGVDCGFGDNLVVVRGEPFCEIHAECVEDDPDINVSEMRKGVMWELA